ncbi:hypothetical protein L1987_33615 [Smallanthus sonchifolius]|uniref:Uncharacterized protein n=1 Tax=Smallanthus sonchifolius TaxID=185202 RepID=A0ACB9HRC5_9ASTR|nr:hypothetical protein L1987_33615 [Smallanthus sonchifolius]
MSESEINLGGISSPQDLHLVDGGLPPFPCDLPESCFLRFLPSEVVAALVLVFSSNPPTFTKTLISF